MTLQYPEVARLLNCWINDQRFSNLSVPFAWKSFVIHKDLEVCLHQDTVDEGPSIVKNLSPCEGGELRYFVNDDRKVPLRELAKEAHVDLDIHRHAVFMDSERGHQGMPFKDERLSMVAFTRQGAIDGSNLSNQLRKQLRALSFVIPTVDCIRDLKATLWQDSYKLLSRKRCLEQTEAANAVNDVVNAHSFRMQGITLQDSCARRIGACDITACTQEVSHPESRVKSRV